MRHPVRSTRSGRALASLTTSMALEALSATVSWILIFQSWMRESTISKHAFTTLGRRQHVRRSEPGSAEIALEHERDLALGARLDQASHRHRAAVVDEHLRSQVAEVGLVHPERLLDDLARHADLLADVLDALALELACDDGELNAIRVVDGDRRLAVRERRDREAPSQRPVELVAVCVDLVGIHGLPQPNSAGQ